MKSRVLQLLEDEAIGCYVQISPRAMAKRLGIGRKLVVKYLEELKQQGLVKLAQPAVGNHAPVWVLTFLPGTKHTNPRLETLYGDGRSHKAANPKNGLAFDINTLSPLERESIYIYIYKCHTYARVTRARGLVKLESCEICLDVGYYLKDGIDTYRDAYSRDWLLKCDCGADCLKEPHAREPEPQV